MAALRRMNFYLFLSLLFFFGSHSKSVSQIQKHAAIVAHDDDDGEEEETGGQEASDWFLSQREYPFDELPSDGRLRALRASGVELKALDPLQPYWTSLGPAPSFPFFESQGVNSGRINTIAISPADPNIVLIGAATGGVWRSTDGGKTFLPVTDNQVDSAVGSIAFSKSNPSIVYAGLGDFATSYLGNGVLKSTDAGQTWLRVSGATLRSPGAVRKIAVDPGNPNRVYVALYDYRSNGTTFSGGFYFSSDGGATWTLSRLGLVRDLAINPADPLTIYLASNRDDSTPSFGAGVYKSTNGGQTWQSMYSPPYTTASDVAVAVTPADPQTIYVLAGSVTQSDYRVAVSNDGGKTFTSNPLTSDVDIAQFGYNTYLAADPSNASVLYLGSRDVWKSLDGGQTWKNLNGNFATRTANFTPDRANAHPDQHSLAFSSADPNVVFFGNDGGLYKSPDAGTTFQEMNDTLSLVQFYSVTLHPTDKTLFFGGTQDNSTQRMLAQRGAWTQMFTGDGGPTVIDALDPNFVFITLDRDVYRYKNRGQTIDRVTRVVPTFETSTARIGFVPPMVGNGVDATLYYGTWRLFVSTDLGVTWSSPAPTTDLTKNTTDKLSVVYVSSANPDVIYTGSEQGRVMLSRNRGVDWTDITNTLPNRFIKSIVSDSINPEVAYVTVSGYGSSHVFKTVNAGAQWTDINGNLPDVPANTLLVDPKDPNIIYVGTDIGVFRSVVGGNTWSLFNNGMPPAVVTSIVAQPGGLIRLGTYGRGAYELVDPSNVIVDTTGPAVAITSHTDGQTVTTSSITLRGTATDAGRGDNGISQVLVNDNRASGDTADGSAVATWSYPLTLKAGANTISVIAGDNSSNRNASATLTITVNYSPPTSSVAPFSLSDKGLSGVTIEDVGNVSVGYGRIVPNSGSTAPSGMAIFGLRQGGVLVSEAAVPATAAIRSGMIYAEQSGSVQTGVAIANPNAQAVTVSFTFRNAQTQAIAKQGSFSIPANGQTAAFLTQTPFLGPSPLFGSFSFDASLPVGAVALRGLTNERGEFLITTMPVADQAAARPTSSLEVAHFADGAGWTTQLVLFNPTDNPVTGVFQWRNDNGAAVSVDVSGPFCSNCAPAADFNYTIPARQSAFFRSSGAGNVLRAGRLSIVPASGQLAPATFAIFSYKQGGVTVSEASVEGITAANAFRLYAEAGSSVQTGIALSAGSAGATVNLSVTTPDGASTPYAGTITVPPNGHVSSFLNQISGFANLPASFRGVLRLSGTNSFAVVGIRGRYNERGDFLITTTAPVLEQRAPAAGESLFPHLAAGGGYSTQVVLFSGAAGQTSAGNLRLFSQSGTALNVVMSSTGP